MDVILGIVGAIALIVVLTILSVRSPAFAWISELAWLFACFWMLAIAAVVIAVGVQIPQGDYLAAAVCIAFAAFMFGIGHVVGWPAVRRLWRERRSLVLWR